MAAAAGAAAGAAASPARIVFLVHGVHAEGVRRRNVEDAAVQHDCDRGGRVRGDGHLVVAIDCNRLQSIANSIANSGANSPLARARLQPRALRKS